MKQRHSIVLFFWITETAPDQHTVDEMREFGELGVYEPDFIYGDRKTLCMNARFDINDKEARRAAIAYAIQNAHKIFKSDYARARCLMWGLEAFLNGEKLTDREILDAEA